MGRKADLLEIVLSKHINFVANVMGTFEIHVCDICRNFEHKDHTWEQCGESKYYWCPCGAVGRKQ